MDFQSLTIGFALTGSFCTFSQVLPQIEKLVEAGANVIPIISYSVDQMDTRFNNAEELKRQLEDITGNEIIRTIPQAEPIGPQGLLDLLIVAPCTSNTLAKIVHSVNDTPVTMAVKSHLRNQKPVVLSISTNDGLSSSGANIGALFCRENIYFVPFGQDSPGGKPFSTVAHNELIIPTVLDALQGKQLQPMLLSY